MADATTPEKAPAKPFNPGQFAQEVRQEASKITWPDRKEVGVTTGVVVWLAILMALYLFVVDFSVQHLVRGILNLFT